MLDSQRFLKERSSHDKLQDYNPKFKCGAEYLEEFEAQKSPKPLG